MKKVILLIIVVVLVLLGIRAVKHKREQEAKTPAAKEYSVVAKSFTPHTQKVVLTLPYLAIAQNEKDVTLSSKIAGRITAVKKEGDSVKKGEMIAKVDTTDIEAKIASLQVSLSNLLQTHHRTVELYKVKGASIEQMQQEEGKVSALRAQMKALKNSLSYAKILSPTDGIVAKKFANTGTIAMPGKPIISISANSGYSLLVRVPEKIKPKGIVFENKEYKLYPLNSTFHGLFEYKTYIEKSVTSGDRLEVSVVIFNQEAQKLPFDAVLNKDGSSYVLVIDKQKITPLKVHIAASAEEGVVVKENLEGKKLVLAKPDILLKLLSGASLKVEE